MAALLMCCLIVSPWFYSVRHLSRCSGEGDFCLSTLLSGIIANVATLLLEPLTYIHVGSSGAIFGLFGYYISIIIFENICSPSKTHKLFLRLRT